MKVFRLILVVLCGGLLLNGCGGGGSDSSGTLALTVTAPPDSTQPGTAVATYTPAQAQNPIGVEISFSTDSNIIALDSTKRSVGSDGKATVTFRALAVPTDTTVKITASTGGLSQFQLITIKATAGATPVTSPGSTAPASIAFISATPTSITLKGTGGAGRVESSIVTFEARDTAGHALPGQAVDFSLNTTVGGLSLTSVSVEGKDNTTGRVQTIVQAGVISTPVRVTATIRGTGITVASDQLTVTTGIPDQDSFSLASSNMNSESFNVNGVVVPVTVNLADHFNNPVPDGTVVNFTTNAGDIGGSGTSVNGIVTVNWRSQEPRIRVNPAGSSRSMIGRAIILAYTVGEESFTDLNGNGLADPGEFIDTPEAFRDDNMNDVRDPSEPFIDYNSDGVYNTPDGKFNGLLQGPAYIGAPRTKHVFANIETVMSTDTPRILIFPLQVSTTAGDAADIANSAVNSYINAVLAGAISLPDVPPTVGTITGPTSLMVLVTDSNGNTMAAGSKIAIATDFGKLFGGTSSDILGNIGYGKLLAPSIGATASPKAGVGTLTVTVTNAKGTATTVFVPINATL